MESVIQELKELRALLQEISAKVSSVEVAMEQKKYDKKSAETECEPSNEQTETFNTRLGQVVLYMRQIVDAFPRRGFFMGQNVEKLHYKLYFEHLATMRVDTSQRLFSHKAKTMFDVRRAQDEYMKVWPFILDEALPEPASVSSTEVACVAYSRMARWMLDALFEYEKALVQEYRGVVSMEQPRLHSKKDFDEMLCAAASDLKIDISDAAELLSKLRSENRSYFHSSNANVFNHGLEDVGFAAALLHIRKSIEGSDAGLDRLKRMIQDTIVYFAAMDSRRFPAEYENLWQDCSKMDAAVVA